MVGPVLKNAGVTTRIIGSEDMGSATTEQKYFTPIFEENNKYTAISKVNLGIFAVHGYLDGVAPDLGDAPGWSTMYNECHKYGKELWMTETSGYWGNIWHNGSDTSSWAYNQAVYLALKYGKVSGWVWWQLSQVYGTSNIWQGLCNGATPLSTYYVCRQYYKYVKPGAVQVLTSSTDSTVLPLAFYHAAQSRLTIILSNNSTSSKTVTLSMPNLPSPFNAYRTSATENGVVLANVTGNTVTLPSYSITTLYYQASNKAPMIRHVDDTVILMNTHTTIKLTGIYDGDNDNNAEISSVTATSNNTKIIPNPTTSMVNDSTYTLSFTPVTDSLGISQITARVTDKGTSNIFSSVFVNFTVKIIPFINKAPTINSISNLSNCTKNSSKLQTINLSGISDGNNDNNAEIVTISASTSNSTVVRSLKVNYTSGSTGTVTYYPLAVGTVTVTLTVVNSGGTDLGGSNTTVTSFNITIGTTCNSELDEPLSANDLEEYPNPASDYIQVVIPENSNARNLYMIDVTGRTVKEEKITSQDMTVKTANLSAGIYFILVKGDNKVYKSKVTIK